MLRIVLGASIALTAAVLPVFLLGALSVPMQADLVFGESALGAAVTAFFLAGTVAAVPGGRLVDRVGARRSVLVGVTVSAGVGLAVALWVSTWWHLVVALCVGGAVLGLVDPGGAALFSAVVPVARQGRAFGVKEASVPTASLTAGVVLPLAVGAVGWRPLFALPLLALPVVWLLLARAPTPTGPGVPAPGATGTAPLRGLFVVSLGTASAAAAATATAAFLVPAAVAADLSTRVAGALLAGGSVLAVIARLAMGVVVDRAGVRPLRVAAGMMGVGAAGLLMLAAAAADTLAAGAVPTARGTALALWVPGTALAFAAGWGWTGVMFLAAVRANSAAPASAAGVVLTGLGVGGALGPLAFGWLASTRSYTTSWGAAATAAALGAVLTAVGARLTASAPADRARERGG